jgi:hypothetical protein
MSGLTIRKVEGGYILTHHDTEHVATSEHVANFIVQFWPDVTCHLREKLASEAAVPESPPEPPPQDDRILNT